MNLYRRFFFRTTAAFLLSCAAAALSFAATLKGHIEPLQMNPDGSVKLSGWACAVGNPKPIMVQVYLGGPWPTGTLKAQAAANLPSEPAVALACGAPGTNYRFRISLAADVRLQFANQRIYVHAINPDGGENPTILRSGEYMIPPDTQAPQIENFAVSKASNLTVAITDFVAKDDIAVTGYLLTETSARPLANSARWQTSRPANYTFASYGQKTLYAWAKDAAGNISASKSAPINVTTIRGHVDGVTINADGSLAVSGWACALGNATPIAVHAYAGAAWPQGAITGSTLANRPSEPAVASACNSVGGRHRFSISLPAEVRAQFPLKKLYVHAIDPSGGTNPVLGGSGQLAIPFNPSALPPEDIRVVDTGPYMLGTYVFPAWTPRDGIFTSTQWPAIRSAQNLVSGADQIRKPLLGYYDDSSQHAVDWMIKWSLEHGISLFVYDWYWEAREDKPPGPDKEAPLLAFKNSKYWNTVANKAAYSGKARFALNVTWSNNHTWCFNYCSSATKNEQVKAALYEMFDYLLNNHLNHPQYLRIDKRPVVILWDSEQLRFGADTVTGKSNTMEIISEWQRRARTHSSGAFPQGVYFIAVRSSPTQIHSQVHNLEPETLSAIGIEGLTGYNYHAYATGGEDVKLPENVYRWTDLSYTTLATTAADRTFGKSMSFSDYSRSVQSAWPDHYAKNRNYIPVVNPGWDPSPWRCRTEEHNGVVGLHWSCKDVKVVVPPSQPYQYKSEFKSQLEAAKQFVDRNATLTADGKKLVLGEAWDEWGEGAVLAPTERWGFGLLEAISEVFGRR